MNKHIIPLWTYIPTSSQRKQIEKTISRIVISGKYILGPEVQAFEQEFAVYNGNTDAIGVASGTDALIIAFKALEICPGDEVITIPNSDIASVMSIVTVGAKPVFIDVSADTLLMDPSKLEKAITKKTKCIVPVHLFGQMCDMNSIMTIAKKYKIAVIEDGAQAFGAEYKFQESKEQRSQGARIPRIQGTKKEKNLATWNLGNLEPNLGRTRLQKAGTIGDIGTFSFYPTKVLGGFGDGGMIVTNNKKFADRIRLLRMRGTKGDYYARIHGMNSRLDELQAALLRINLNSTETSIQKRRAIAMNYQKNLPDTPLTLTGRNPDSTHVWHQFVVRTTHRDSFREFLKRKGVFTGTHYPYPLHLMPAYTFLGYTKGDFPVAEKACKQVVSLPMYPELKQKDQQRVIKAIKTYFS